MANSDEMMEQKIKHLFHQCDSFFEALKITFQLVFWDVFTASDNRTKTALGFTTGLILFSVFMGSMQNEKAFLLYMVYSSIGSTITSILLCLVFGQGGFFSYLFYAGSMPFLIGLTPFLSMICGFKYARNYVSFRRDMHLNLSGRLTGTKGTKRMR